MLPSETGGKSRLDAVSVNAGRWVDGQMGLNKHVLLHAEDLVYCCIDKISLICIAVL